MKSAAGAEKRRAEHIDRIAMNLRAAGVDASRPVGGGTLLTEDVVVMDGAYRADYRLERIDGTSLGSAGPAAAPRSGYRACYALEDVDRTPRLLLLVASRRSEQADLVLTADGPELARLEKPAADRDGGPFGQTRPRRLAAGLQRLGLAPRTVIAERTRIGSVIAERRVGRLPRRRIVCDSSGAGVATITMTLPLTGIDRFYVIDLDQSIDERLRAVALLTPYLWDGYTIAWTQGGT